VFFSSPVGSTNPATDTPQSELQAEDARASEMSDAAIYQDSDVTITSSQLVYQNDYYPLHSIKSVVSFKEPLDVKGLAINAVLAVGALIAIFSFKAICAIVGLLALGVCGFNLYTLYQDMTNPTFVVAVTFHSNKSIYMKRRSAEWARRVHDALHDAMRH
jgi:hypothetical protein